MKSSNIKFVAVSTALWFAAGCSDPSEGVHRTSGSAPQQVAAGTTSGKDYVISEGSKIGFVGSKVTGSHDGGFNKFDGTIRVADGKIVGTPEIKIDLNSIWSDTDRLTGHLKSADFFEVEKYPISTFTVTSVVPSGSGQTITGNLDLHGVSKSISFPATVQVTDDEVTVKAEFAINRKDFNINYSGRADDLIRDNVVIQLDLKATPGAAGPEDQAML